MAERHFTPEEVDRLIPQLSEIVEAAMAQHRQATALQRELAAEQQRIRVAGGSLVDQREWKARAERLDGLASHGFEAMPREALWMASIANVTAVVDRITATAAATKSLIRIEACPQRKWVLLSCWGMPTPPAPRVACAAPTPASLDVT